MERGRGAFVVAGFTTSRHLKVDLQWRLVICWVRWRYGIQVFIGWQGSMDRAVSYRVSAVDIRSGHDSVVEYNAI